MKEKLIIIGIGQLAQDIRFFVERYELFDIVGYAVNEEYIKEEIYEGLPVYPVENLEEFVNKDEVYVFVAISWFQYLNRVRKDMYLYLKDKGFKFANLISPNATILTDNIGDGNWICDFAYLDFETSIGSNNMIRNYGYIGHYASIGDHCFIGAKSLIGGNSKLGDQIFVGINATVFNDITVGDKCIVGGTATAKKSLPNCSVCKVGNEVMVIKQYTDETIESKLIPGDVLKKSK